MVRAVEGMARFDNIHMDNHQFAKAEKRICPVGRDVERVATELSVRPLAAHSGAAEEDISD